MNILDAVVLGLIQGLSEFLPISSTAHLTLAGHAMHLIDPAAPERWTAFIAVIQLGTLLAVLVYFWSDLVSIVRDFVRDNLRRIPFSSQSDASRMGWLIIVGTIPIVIVGLALKDVIEGALTKELVVIAISLIALGMLLELAERVAKFNRPIDSITLRDSLLIGLAQCVALIPGSSRSGTTITAGLFLGLDREAAARFSFLLSIPAVLASGLLEFYQQLDSIDSTQMVTLVVATLFAFISGYAAIAFLLRYLRTHTVRLFVVYRIVLGAAILVGLAVAR